MHPVAVAAAYPLLTDLDMSNFTLISVGAFCTRHMSFAQIFRAKLMDSILIIIRKDMGGWLSVRDICLLHKFLV